MNEEYIVALYLRISSEDDVLDPYCESGSIAGQRLLLIDFIRGHKALSSSKRIEIVDDGFSGANFERPGIKKLIEMAKANQVNCIVVKDFSRFGRNYIEVGNYLEHVFPFLGVRFLSVNDCFDSAQDAGAAGAIEIGFKNILHQAYSQDLSRKIKSVRRLKAEKGEHIAAFAPYGFKKVFKNQLVADEECAPVVKRIFDLYMDGMGQTEIARLLNTEHTPSPLMIKKDRNENFCYMGECNAQSHWTASAISKILSDQRYVGDAVYGKAVRKELGSKKNILLPQESWIIVQNAHPCIVEREKFEAAQAKKTKRAYRRGGEKPLSKKVICRACNHALRRIDKGKQAYFQCATHQSTGSYACFTGRLAETELSTAILTYLSALALIAEEKCIEKNCAKKPAPTVLLKKLRGTEKEMERTKSNAFLLYQGFKTGQITKSAFAKKMDGIEAKLAILIEQKEQYEQDYEKAMRLQKNISPADMGRAQAHAPFLQLTKEITVGFLQAVYVEEGGGVSVEWAFNDSFLQTEV